MDDEIDPSTRRELATLAHRPRSRSVGKPPAAPSDWKPFTVANDDSFSGTFSDQSAWDFIGELLAAGEPVRCIRLRVPPGRKGFVMKPTLADGRVLYIKLQLGSGAVIGRSFHYSYDEHNEE
jgi:hypothetical protein